MKKLKNSQKNQKAKADNNKRSTFAEIKAFNENPYSQKHENCGQQDKTAGKPRPPRTRFIRKTTNKVAQAINLFGIKVAKIVFLHIRTNSFFVTFSSAVLAFLLTNVDVLILFVGVYVFGLFLCLIMLLLEVVFEKILPFIWGKHFRENDKNRLSIELLKTVFVVLTSMRLNLLFVAIALHIIDLSNTKADLLNISNSIDAIKFLIVVSALSAVVADILSVNNLPEKELNHE